MNVLCFDIETTGLNAWFGDFVTCICAKYKDKSFKVSLNELNEENLILGFLEWILNNNDKGSMLLSKNGKGFDIPFMLSRLAQLNPDKLKVFSRYLLSMEHFDLQDITKKWVSLENMAIIQGFSEDQRKTGNGLLAIQLYHAKRWPELIDYCWRDVILTEKVYYRLMQLRNKKVIEEHRESFM